MQLARSISLLVAFSLLASAATAHAECSPGPPRSRGEQYTVPAQILFGDAMESRANRRSGAKVFSGTKE
jgi:hypothetical protein